MDGTALYFPAACVWMAVLNNEDVNIASYLLLIILATVGSAGSAPVPSAGLVLIITAYNTVFNASGTPNGFEYIFAIVSFDVNKCFSNKQSLSSVGLHRLQISFCCFSHASAGL